MNRLMRTGGRYVRRVRHEEGSLLIELLVAMTILSIAVAALISIYASSQLSLRHSSIEGNANTLADKQIEVYKTIAYANVQLDASTIPSSGTDPYVTAHSSDSTIPASTGQITGASGASCSAPTTAQPACATQNWTGPDGRSYRVDSYIVNDSISGGRNVKDVTVVVHLVKGGTVDSTVWARATTSIDQSNPPQ
jgi:type II secretory pathway pseudopilin PulG